MATFDPTLRVSFPAPPRSLKVLIPSLSSLSSPSRFLCIRKIRVPPNLLSSLPLFWDAPSCPSKEILRGTGSASLRRRNVQGTPGGRHRKQNAKCFCEPSIESSRGGPTRRELEKAKTSSFPSSLHQPSTVLRQLTSSLLIPSPQQTHTPFKMLFTSIAALSVATLASAANVPRAENIDTSESSFPSHLPTSAADLSSPSPFSLLQPSCSVRPPLSSSQASGKSFDSSCLPFLPSSFHRRSYPRAPRERLVSLLLYLPLPSRRKLSFLTCIFPPCRCSKATRSFPLFLLLFPPISLHRSLSILLQRVH